MSFERVEDGCCALLDVGHFHSYNTSGGVSDLCRMPIGVTSNTYCDCNYCIFSVTPTLTYNLRDLCHMPMGVT